MTTEEKILELVKQADPDNPIAYVNNIVKGFAISKLDDYIAGCEDCKELCSGCKSITRGNSNASVMIIGEAVLEEQKDDTFVRPFEGTDCDRILNAVFEDLGINTEEIFYINAVNCWPHKNVGPNCIKRAPSKSEVTSCSLFVEYAIKTVQPLVVIALGNVAMNLYHKGAISKDRGQWYEIMGIPAIATYHPGYFGEIEGKKSPDEIEQAKWDFYNDIKRAFMYIQETDPKNSILTALLEAD